MKQFIYDMIHMTEGEKLINYWWLWLLTFLMIVAVAFINNFIKNKRRKKK